MGKPKDIPQDVWDAATYALFGSIPDDMQSLLSVNDRVHLGRTARAIMVERDRCAKIAAAAAMDAEAAFKGLTALNAAAYMHGRAQSVVAAIRSGAPDA